MSINLIKKDESNSNDLTIFLTVTTTYTLSGSELEIVPSTTTISTKMAKITSSASITSTKITSSQKSTSSQKITSSQKVTSSQKSSSVENTSTKISSLSNESSITSASTTSTSTNKNKSIDGLMGSNGSVKLGLAIGVPVSIIGIIIIIILAFIYVKKSKKKPTKMVSYNNEFFKVKNNTVPKNDTSSSLDSYSIKERKINQDTSNIEPLEPMKQNDKRYSIRTYLKDRFSKVINVNDLESEFDSPKIKSPILKKFNLEKPISSVNFNEPLASWLKPRNTNSFISRIEPQFLPISFKDLKRNQNNENNKELPEIPENVSSKLSNTTETLDNEYSNEIGTVQKVSRNYRKRREDEVDVDIGENVYILQSHSDGWCMIKSVSNEKKTGYIPKLCLEGLTK